MRPSPSSLAPEGLAAGRGSSHAPAAFGPGFYGEDSCDGLRVRWLSLSGRLEITPSAEERFLELSVYSHFHDLSQTLTVEPDGAASGSPVPLSHGWNLLSLPVPSGTGAVALRVNKPYPREYYPNDPRELGVLVRDVGLDGERARHEHVARQHANTVLNRREMLEGKVELASTPRLLGIDVQGACNVKPPCVYCAWDFSKQREGANVDVPFTLDTLAEWGAFFDGAAMVVNCSIGEPFMMKDIDPLLDAFGERGKLLEMTTNGQILTDANIARLLGRDAHLYVSLDAATAATYARLRNDRFEAVLGNLRRLVAAKGGRGRLPLVYVVFMPMAANRHEVDAIVDLCAELQVDRLVLRPLNRNEGMNLVWDRAGYHYDYAKELLPWPELVRISGRTRERARARGLDLSDQLDFGGELQRQFPEHYEAGRREAQEALAAEARVKAPAAIAATGAHHGEPSGPSEATSTAAVGPPPSLGQERLPICTEPWSSLYVLRRGTLPCCYGGGAIAPMNGYREAWNGPAMLALRRELLRGRFPGYCHDSPDCPIVKKAAEARSLDARQRFRRWLRRSAHAAARSGGGVPVEVYRFARRQVRAIRRRLSAS